jgi:hypothetical protein
MIDFFELLFSWQFIRHSEKNSEFSPAVAGFYNGPVGKIQVSFSLAS